MLGAIQIGIILAGAVLFIPMVSSGYHLSRNKLLFFAFSLFITLAIFVHVTPHLPSLSLLLSSLSPPPSSACFSLLHDIVFEDSSWAWTRSDMIDRSTGSTRSIDCGFRRFSRSDSVDLLSRSWIVVAGDSQARLFTLSLLKLVIDDSDLVGVDKELFKRHSDYQIVDRDIGLKVDFRWAPLESNLTDLVESFGESKQSPDVLVMGSGLWHMLHVSKPEDYGIKLGDLRESAVSLSSLSLERTRMFWLGMPTLVNGLLNSEEKREKMGQGVWEEYVREMRESGILREKGGPFSLLDVGSLSRSCGEKCAEDGMHYDEVVYDAAVHVMLNALRLMHRLSV